MTERYSQADQNEIEDGIKKTAMPVYTSKYIPPALGGHIRSRDGNVIFSLERELTPQAETLRLKITNIQERDSDYLMYAFVDGYSSTKGGKNLENGSPVVLKFIRPGIYPFSDIMKEQQQRKELTLQRDLRNSKFSPDIYGGFCRIVKMPPLVDLYSNSYGSFAFIDSFTDDHSSLINDTKAEYAIVMYLLAKNSLRDVLQSRGFSDIDRRLLNESMMRKIDSPVVPREVGGMEWGSPEQLERKLRLNLLFIEEVKRENSITHTFNQEELSTILGNFKTTMLDAVSNSSSLYVQKYFPKRQPEVTEGHGDSHTGNLIIKFLRGGYPIWRRIDCIDYNNPDLYILDPLNDYAMLPTDIVVRTDAVSIVNDMVKDYFEENHLNGNPAAIAVFDYAVLEKLWVLFYVRFLFDKDRSKSALQTYLTYMQKQIPKVQQNTLEQPKTKLPVF